MATSPTQRTLRKLRAEGYHVQVVERWVPQARKRVDLWGIIDVVAIKRGENLLVQCTSYTNVSSRIRKIQESVLKRDETEDEGTLELLKHNGHRVVVHGWQKKGGRWVCREVEL